MFSCLYLTTSIIGHRKSSNGSADQRKNAAKKSHAYDQSFGFCRIGGTVVEKTLLFRGHSTDDGANFIHCALTIVGYYCRTCGVKPLVPSKRDSRSKFINFGGNGCPQ